MMWTYSVVVAWITGVGLILATLLLATTGA